MSKLKAADRFYDFSDYGRPIARQIASFFQSSSVTAVHISCAFLLAGLLAIYFILDDHYLLAGLFLIIKSILDAADGELARLQNRPSYVGRFLDSIFDFLLNFGIVLAICLKSETSWLWMLLAFVSLEFQGSLYNYYYTIQRARLQGDTTSRIQENSVPQAFEYESQRLVTWLFYIFRLMYSAFDRLAIWLDPGAPSVSRLPNWFMSLISLYGLGFQLLIISVFLPLGLITLLLPFFIGYNLLSLLFVGLRRLLILPVCSA